MKKILAAIDFSEITTKVVEQAAVLAAALGAELEILHVVAPEPAFVGYAAYSYPGRDERAEELREEKKDLQKLVERVRTSHAGLEVSAYMKEAPSAVGIVEFAHNHEAGIIVLGVHSKSAIRRALLGSTSQDVVSKTTIPVLLVPASGEKGSI